jgi:L-Ala-D/L-Glu epimerase
MNNPAITGVRLASVARRSYPIRGGFTISRGAKRVAEVVEVVLEATRPDGTITTGRGECVPYPRYGENPAQTVAEIQAALAVPDLNRLSLQGLMPLGAARNAIDCAFWDLESKLTRTPVWRLAGLPAEPKAVATAFTISLASPEAMAEAARVAAMPLLKLKLGGGAEDISRVTAVRKAAPQATLIVDANEGWAMSQLFEIAPQLAALGVDRRRRILSRPRQPAVINRSLSMC